MSVSDGILKMSQLSNERPGRHLGCLIGLKNTNLVEDFDILLPFKFRTSLFIGVSGDFEYV